ncbi:hypothetical protein [Nonomuraea turkmeniaca]|uniref:hypothetical protein n=1 Tax=Nonomuraea turkmeniaca TaxID=103838 RepID=UPI001476FA82|nr:hypothetical protein [Nonomuraea turkmeniaca]
MTGRTGRAAVVCAALGVLWWATVRLAWAGVGCADWGCLVPAVWHQPDRTHEAAGLAGVLVEL